MSQTISVLPPKEAELRAGFWDQVDSFPDGHKIKKCLQCGTCTGSCPVSYVMDITPREVIALFRAGRIEEILRSRTIWICASCYSCTVRCPVEIKVTDTLYALKRLAMESHTFPPDVQVDTLSRAFIRNIYKYGRNYELGLGISYYLRTSIGRAFANALMPFKMVPRKRLGIFPRRIKNIKQMRAIIDRANQFGEGS